MKKRFTVHTLFLCLVLALACFAVHAAAEPYVSELGARFGMTVEEVQEIEARNSRELKGNFETDTSFQLYYETGVSFYSLACSRMEYDFDVDQRLLFQVYYVSKGGKEDYDYAKSRVTELYGAPEDHVNEAGKYSLLYNQIGGGDSNHTEESHWLIAGDAARLGIDIWYNEYDTVFIMFYDADNPASYGELPKYYRDELGVSFSYPEGEWDSLDANLLAASGIKANAVFVQRSNSDISIQYMRLDLWESIRESSEPMGYKREDFGEAFLDDDVVGILMDPSVPENLTTKEINGNMFKMFVHVNESDGTTPAYYNAVAMNLKNGYLHMFQLSALSAETREANQAVFEQMISTIEIK